MADLWSLPTLNCGVSRVGETTTQVRAFRDHPTNERNERPTSRHQLSTTERSSSALGLPDF
jgi:hypothetical protein